MTLGKRIQRARKRLRPRLTQQALADAMGVTKSAVSAWERDVDPPTGTRIPKLREILKVRYEWLHEEDGPMEELSGVERDAVDALIAALRRQRVA